ncbi:hypothetical protein [Motilibacter aurantiacus]|uniref:hypothetical protein n=1 Tax=Motilibacter aurantiacus TaxID=2714955 RepID=UPI00140DAD38|nr:hypothetical protein [Motilibacter aurantiacus]NHC43966.1 hypothetical protein [Motilibacter aurantiacus]
MTPAAPGPEAPALQSALEAMAAHIAAARLEHDQALAAAAADERLGRRVEHRAHQRRADRAELRLSVWLQAYALLTEEGPARLPLSA